MNTILHHHNTNSYLPSGKLLLDIQAYLNNIDFRFHKGCGRGLKDSILKGLHKRGWSESVSIHSGSNISITSYKDEHGLCFQTGNMSRFYADLLKMEYLKKKGKISAGFYIIPTKSVAKVIGSNIANFERFARELKLYQEIITTPITTIGIQK